MEPEHSWGPGTADFVSALEVLLRMTKTFRDFACGTGSHLLHRYPPCLTRARSLLSLSFCVSLCVLIHTRRSRCSSGPHSRQPRARPELSVGSDQSGKDKIRKDFRILLFPQAGETGIAKLFILPPSAVAGTSSPATVAGARARPQPVTPARSRCMRTRHGSMAPRCMHVSKARRDTRGRLVARGEQTRTPTWGQNSKFRCLHFTPHVKVVSFGSPFRILP